MLKLQQSEFKKDSMLHNLLQNGQKISTQESKAMQMYLFMLSIHNKLELKSIAKYLPRVPIQMLKTINHIQLSTKRDKNLKNPSKM